MAAENTPAADQHIDAQLVRRLVDEQFPGYAGLALSYVGAGWDNEIYRLGSQLTVRLPRRVESAELIVNELRWLPEIAPHLTLPISSPIHGGSPTDAYPYVWAIGPWFDGTALLDTPLAEPAEAADTLGRFVASFHRIAPVDAPRNPYRGVPLALRHQRTLDHISQLGYAIDGHAVREVWERCLAAPPWVDAPLWLHGDLHPGNLIASDGHLTAAIDFGDLCCGDPATDLAVGFMAFDRDHRETFRARAGGSADATWERARGWAIALALAYLTHSADNPPYERIGHRALNAALNRD